MSKTTRQRRGVRRRLEKYNLQCNELGRPGEIDREVNNRHRSRLFSGEVEKTEERGGGIQMNKDRPGDDLLLPNEAPVRIQQSIARLVGIKGAVILQRLHEALLTEGKEFNGRIWISGTLEEWQARFEFMKLRTMRRVFVELQETGILLSDNLNQSKMDRTRWYTINYERLGSMLVGNPRRNNSMAVHEERGASL